MNVENIIGGSFFLCGAKYKCNIIPVKAGMLVRNGYNSGSISDGSGTKQKSEFSKGIVILFSPIFGHIC